MSGKGLGGQDSALDLMQIAEDERLLSALACGTQVPVHEQAITELLAGWRDELDDAAASLPPVDLTSLLRDGSAQRRQFRGRRAVVAAAAGVVTVLGMTGTAAAISGPNGPLAPLHRVFFGTPHSVSDPLALRARSLLDDASSRISGAAAAGSISSSERAAIGAVIDSAARLLQDDAHAPETLVGQADSLRTALARIPDEPTSAIPTTAVNTPPPTDPRKPAPEPTRTAAPPEALPPSSGPTTQPEPDGSGGGPVTAPTQDGGQPEPSSPASSSAGGDGTGDTGVSGGSDSSSGS